MSQQIEEVVAAANERITYANAQIQDGQQQIRAWEKVANRALERAVVAERELALSQRREQETLAELKALNARTAEMGDLVATSVGQVDELKGIIEKRQIEQHDAADSEGQRQRHAECEQQLQVAQARVTELEDFIARTGDDRAEAARRGALVMREMAARHVGTHPNKAVAGEISAHIRHVLQPPTIDQINRFFQENQINEAGAEQAAA